MHQKIYCCHLFSRVAQEYSTEFKTASLTLISPPFVFAI